MPSINLLRAQSDLSRLLENLEQGVEREFVITRKGKPVAKLVPMHNGCAAGQRLGIAKGAFTLPDSIGQHDAAVAAQLSQ